LYENGNLEADVVIPGGVPFSKGKVYFAHYCYHTAQEIHDIASWTPYETYWEASTLLPDPTATQTYGTPFSDERHWDNMGFEVLPSSTNWADTSANINQTAPLPSSAYGPNGTTTAGGSSSGSGGGSGGSGGTTSTSQTVTGTVSGISQSDGQAAVATIDGASPAGTYTLSTSDSSIGGQLISACAAGSTVTVTYTTTSTAVTSAASVASVEAASSTSQKSKSGKITKISVK
jgi:hypothetical protein